MPTMPVSCSGITPSPHGATGQRVAVIYHFFPHYRKGVVRELAKSGDFTFVGDIVNHVDGIPALEFDRAIAFVPARTYRLGRFLLQPKALSMAAVGGYDTLVFLANTNILTTWCAAAIGRLRGRRVVFWGHGYSSDRSDFKNLVRTLFFSLAHAFYSYGYRSKQIAVRRGFSPDTLYVGFNSLDYCAQLPLRTELLHRPAQQQSALGRACLRIVCVSRLTAECRYDLLFRAVSIAATRDALPATVTIVGDGPERSRLEELAVALGIDVDFRGAIYDEARVADFLFHADVTVSPGKVGLTAIHSLMFGTPVISHADYDSQMPEVEAVVEGYTGMLFRKDDADDLARALTEVRKVFPDRARTRANCFAMVDRVYNPARQVEVLMAAIQGRPPEEGNDAWTLFPLGGAHGAT